MKQHGWTRLDILKGFLLIVIFISSFHIIAADDTTITPAGDGKPVLSVREDDLKFKSGATQELTFSLENAESFNALQFDLFLPDGVEIVKTENKGYAATISSTTQTEKTDHILAANKVSNGSYRFVVYSPINANFYSATTITLKIIVTDTYKDGNIQVKDLIASQKENDEVKDVEGTDFSFTTELLKEVESITLNKTSVTLKVTDTVNLSVTYTPADAVEQSVVWSSSDTSVATVSEDGTVTAVKVGTAIITATTPNGKTASCEVIVEATPAESVTIATPTSTTFNVGETLILNATVLPELTTDKTLTWNSSKTDVATVDNDGVVTAKKAGTVEITASCGTVISNKVELTVTNHITSLSINVTSIGVTVGKETTLVATYMPSDASPVNLQWSSSDTDVATVSDKGVVTGIKAGTATITVKDSTTGLSAICTVTVAEILYGDADGDGSIAINDVVLIVNHILELTPENFDSSRIDVDQNGKINIMDVTKTIELVLAQTPQSVRKAHTAMNTRSPNDAIRIGAITFDENHMAVIPVLFESDDLYTAIQMDIDIPNGMTIEKITKGEAATESHSSSMIILDESTGRVVIFSPTLDTFMSGQTLVNMTMRLTDSDDFEGGYLGVSNVIASFTTGKGLAVAETGVSIEAFSDVEALSAEKESAVYPQNGAIRVISRPGMQIRVFNVAGSGVAATVSSGDDTFRLSEGLYIVVVDGKTFKVKI